MATLFFFSRSASIAVFLFIHLLILSIKENSSGVMVTTCKNSVMLSSDQKDCCNVRKHYEDT